MTEICRYFAIAFACFCYFSRLSGNDVPQSFRVQMLALDANEGIAIGDVDGDGRADVVAGRNWYRGGDWTPRPLRIIDDWNGYVESNGDFLYDVNGDGRIDVIAGSFLPTQVYWYENPGPAGLRLGKLWPKHLLVDTKRSTNEAQLFTDIDRDGRPEWLVNSWRGDVPMVLWRMVDKSSAEVTEGEATIQFVPHTLGPRGNGHGMGVGDISGDGRIDVLVGQGWYEQPVNQPWSGPWKFHRDWDLHASIPMIVTDLDGDADGDIILGNGHDYGLFWWQNEGPDDDGSLQWTKHQIDSHYSQPHTLAWQDIDGDGQRELITGKRYYAHNGNDPGGNEMPCLYYYDWDRSSLAFQRHTIEEGHVGCGLQIATADLNGDAKTDIAVAGKSGTYLLFAE